VHDPFSATASHAVMHEKQVDLNTLDLKVTQE